MVPVIRLHPRPLPEPLSNSALRLWLGRAKELEVASLVSSKQDLSQEAGLTSQVFLWFL